MVAPTRTTSRRVGLKMHSSEFCHYYAAIRIKVLAFGAVNSKLRKQRKVQGVLSFLESTIL
jgi:hypothetical protein